MEFLRTIFLMCLSVHLRVHVKATVQEERNLKVAEAVKQLFEENPTIDDTIQPEYPILVRRVRHPFVCPTLEPSLTTPTSVDRLRPGDINIVGAIGDSLTAALGAQGGVGSLLYDSRGLSWSAGGDLDFSKMSTIPNILREYNPNLWGYSLGNGNGKAGLNVAVSGAKSRDGFLQAVELVRRMRADPKVNMTEDWKLFTVFLGANDLCDWCEDEIKYSAAIYKDNLKSTLDYLIANVPRAFINLVEMIPVDHVVKLANNAFCKLIHTIICNCGANPKNAAAKAKLTELRLAYQAVARELAESSRYQTRHDFAVVLQPFYANTTVPTKPNGQNDLSYFASDCFHLSKKGQATAAEALWNNMFEPVGSKRTTWTPGDPLVCPSEDHPFLYTAKNSGTIPQT